MSSVHEDLKQVPGIKFVDHVAIAVKQGDLDGQVKAYEMLGFREIHREEVLGSDQVREALLQIGDGPNLIQLLEPLTPDSPVQKTDRAGTAAAAGWPMWPSAWRARSRRSMPCRRADFKSSTRLRAKAREGRRSSSFIPNREPKIHLGF